MNAAEVFDLTGKVICVTGSTRGIGRAMTSHFTEHGATVVVHGRGADAVAAALDNLPERSRGVSADVRDLAAMEAAAGEIEEALGRLDAVVCNVGGAAQGNLDDLDPRMWSKMLDLNLTGAYNTARVAYPLLRANKGTVVMISATAGHNPAPMFAAYGAAKAGVEHLTRSLAAEWGPEVRVNSVAPGLVLTEGSKIALFAGDNEMIEKAGGAMAVGRVGQPEDIAWAVHFLISPAAAYISGAVLDVDGGPTQGVAQRVSSAMK